MTRILVLGSGGREHALAWAFARDSGSEVVIAPGNDWIATRFRCVATPDFSPPALAALAERERADLVVVGPEAPLAAGVADALEACGVPVFGPTRGAARLESSKAFAKEVLRAAHVPTARATRCESPAEIERALDHHGSPYVVKLDGLAAGKGVRVTASRAEAAAFAARGLERAEGSVLIEQHLAGEEASVMAICDGEQALLLPAARDYKRARDGDQGPNTGGMGAYAPLAEIEPELEERILRSIVMPTLNEMNARGVPFRGVLYCGLMVSPLEVNVVEFNVRFGDPEAQAILPLVAGSLTRLCASAAAGALEPGAVGRRTGGVVVVALVSEDYPEDGADGTVVGLEALAGEPGIEVFGAAMVRDGNGWRGRGGRMAYVLATGEGVTEAHQRAYRAVDTLGGRGWRCRRDIAACATLHESPRPVLDAPHGGRI